MVENYTKDIKESVYHGAVISALVMLRLYNDWKNFKKYKPSISQ